MATFERWLLPQGIEEALPQQAARLEALRRKLLDVYASWGYQLVMPPFIEYLESLLTGTGHDLDLQTFQLIDQLTGRPMGIRADMTPQVARIDAHQLKKDCPNRLCYIGTVLHTRPDGFGGSRSPLQVGAELYGHAGIESDLEIISLMLESFKLAGIDNLVLDIGHVGIFGGLAKQAGLDEEQEATLFELLQRKAVPAISDFLAQLEIKDEVRQMLASLVELHGSENCLTQARQLLASADDAVLEALDYLKQVAYQLKQSHPTVNLQFDLGELRGYHYHTGILFAVFVPEQGQEIARGGRYDDIGQDFGRARPATGFSTDLKSLVDLSMNQPTDSVVSAIFAPHSDDPALDATIVELRAQGEIVIVELPGQLGDATEMGCNRVLVQRDGQWSVEGIA